jgi:hypothetical protein
MMMIIMMMMMIIIIIIIIIIINSNKRIVATVYSLGTLFVSGIYVQLPCIKEIMMIINTSESTNIKAQKSQRTSRLTKCVRQQKFERRAGM